jgi:hypothetical protein
MDVKVELKEMQWEGMNWINLAQDREKWWAVVSTLMNLGLHKM